MRLRAPFQLAILFSFLACTSDLEEEPHGPTARLGTTPAIDGVFDEGEWDDAEIVRVGATELFRIKHDSVNLFFGVRAGGGDIRLNTATGMRVLHWSSQLGSAEYIRSDSSVLSLDRPFSYELWGLHHEPPNVIQEALADYLAANGWVSNLASMGGLMESEIAVSLDLLGVEMGPDRFVEVPGVRIFGGLMLSRGDPRIEDINALAPEERRRLYPDLAWPTESASPDSVAMGHSPATIRLDPRDFGRIWIDLVR